jgi:hypothetical protein
MTAAARATDTPRPTHGVHLDTRWDVDVLTSASTG